MVAFLDGSVHPLGLIVGPWVLWLGELVLDAVLGTDAVEDVGAEVASARTVTVFGQVGEGHAVIGQHRMDDIGGGVDHATHERGAVHLACVVAELGVGELGHAVDGEE